MYAHLHKFFYPQQRLFETSNICLICNESQICLSCKVLNYISPLINVGGELLSCHIITNKNLILADNGVDAETVLVNIYLLH